MVLAISAKPANTAAAGMSFITFLCLLLVNLGTPIIKSIYIANYVGVGSLKGTMMIFGVYGECADNSQTNYINVNNFYNPLGVNMHLTCANTIFKKSSSSYGGSGFLLIMHAIGVITSFMLICIGIYARSRVVYKKATWVSALFSSFIILLAFIGQIDRFLQLKKRFNDSIIFTKSTATLNLSVSGVSLVIIPFLFSLLSVIAFYIGDQAVSERGDISATNYNNHNGHMNTVITDQQLVPEQSQISQAYLNSQYDKQFSELSNQQSYSNPRFYTNHEPYLNTDYQPHLNTNYQPHSNTNYPPYSNTNYRPHSNTNYQPYLNTNYQPYSNTNH